VAAEGGVAADRALVEAFGEIVDFERAERGRERAFVIAAARAELADTLEGQEQPPAQALARPDGPLPIALREERTGTERLTDG
jgi:hypothetical protein